jgi:hypothetical protein
LLGLLLTIIPITSIFVGKMTEKNEKTATRFGGNKRPDKNKWSNDI